MLRVLLPTDFSQNAHNAIRYALSLLKDTTCTFYLLHTYTPAIYRTDYILKSPAQYGLGDTYQTTAVTELEKLEANILDEFKNPRHSFVTHTAFNILLDEVGEIVDNENIDLIIMGTQGATGAKEIFLGTHTVHVIKKAKVPVLAIPPDYKFEEPQHILFPTDYEVDYSEEKLKLLLKLAAEYKSKIEVLYLSYGYELSDHQEKNKGQLKNLLKPFSHEIHEWSNQLVIEGINKFQEKQKVQLLTMIRNKHTFVERLFIEPVIKKIGFHSTIPFMVIPHNA